MAKKKSSSTAALVEHNVSDEEHPDRLPIEETWPTETQPDEDDGTEVFGSVSEYRDAVEALGEESTQAESLTIGLSSTGAFIAAGGTPAPIPDSPKTRKTKETVASMPRELAFAKFRDSLFTLCFKFGFTLEADGISIRAFDVSDAKGSAKRALAVANMADLELRK
jgi:hypothetical protein